MGVDKYIFTVETLIDIKGAIPCAAQLLRQLFDKGCTSFLYGDDSEFCNVKKYLGEDIPLNLLNKDNKNALDLFFKDFASNCIIITSNEELLKKSNIAGVLTSAIVSTSKKDKNGNVIYETHEYKADIHFHSAPVIEKFIDTLLLGNVQSIKMEALTGDIPIALGDTICFIKDYIKNHDVKHVLEIGSAIGYSAIEMARLGAIVTTIEKDIERFQKAQDNIKKEGFCDKVNIICGDALTIDINNWEGRFDLIFIDAAKSQYIKFFERYKNCLSKNGVIISDNLNFHGMVHDPTLTRNRDTKKLLRKIAAYRKFLEDNSEYITEFFDTGDGISLTKRRD